MSISAMLGYPDDSLEPRVHPGRLPEVNALMGRLKAIDELIASALADSMAVAVGDLKLDYNAHLAQLKAEGDRLLRNLSALTGLAIAFNKYTGATRRGSKHSVVSYW